MPAGPELAAAPDVGHGIAAAALEPQLAGQRVIDRQFRQVEAAIGVQQGRVQAVQLLALGMDQEVGDFRAVLGGRRLLLDLQLGGVELGGQGLDRLRRWRGRVGQLQLGRGEESFDRVEDVVALRQNASLAKRRRCR
jgi:hypothetical protein